MKKHHHPELELELQVHDFRLWDPAFREAKEYHALCLKLDLPDFRLKDPRYASLVLS
jgi:hypothetical protein